MQKLLEQFDILEKTVIELVLKKESLQLECKKLKETNKLLKEEYLLEKEETIDKQINQGRIDNRLMLASEEVEMFRNEIDECLDILKTIK